MDVKEKLTQLYKEASVYAREAYGKRNHIPDCCYATADDVIEYLIANGVTIPVRCKNCINGIYDEANNIYKCVKSADYDPEYDDWLGFVSYHNADYYCADGERRF